MTKHDLRLSQQRSDRLNFCLKGNLVYSVTNKILNQKGLVSLSLLLILPLITPKNLLIQPVEAQTNPQQRIATETNILYVDSAKGRDEGDGSEQSPFKTITQALKLAQPNTIINLSPGTYSEETGESFPLTIAKSVTIQGSPSSKGHNVIITGSGYFASPTGAGQQVTISAMKKAQAITGVTVINTHTRGHGLWIESASPTITNNSFIRNGNTGLSVNGRSNPAIENNYFSRNAGNGLLIYGTSKPQVTNNEFKNTGFGVSIVQNASPTLIGNSFSGNRIGVIVEGNAQAVLRENEITNSLEYGLVAIAKSKVDLGTTAKPGNNIFRGNQKLDIQNATPHPLNAAGTETNGKIEGNVDFHGAANTSVVSNASETKPLQLLSPLPEETPAVVRRTAQPSPIPESSTSNPNTLPPPKTISAPPQSTTTAKDDEIVFTAPPSPSTLSNASPTVEFQSPTSKTNITPSKLPVPSSPQTQSSSNNQISSLSDVLGGLSTASNTVKYKVVAEAKGDRQQAEVRSLYPDAFNTTYQGKSMLQIGVFSNKNTAENVLQSLAQIGIDGVIID